jgi:tetratricopeptide (TPR) repeat protein
VTSNSQQGISSVAALGQLARDRRSGVLALKRKSVGAHICLQDGRVVYATSNLRKFQPARWLVDADLATSTTLKELGKVAGTKQLVDYLVGRSSSDRMQLVTALRNLTREIALDAMTWNQPELNFNSGVPVLRQHVLLEEPLEKLLSEADERLEAAAAVVNNGDPEEEYAPEPDAPDLYADNAEVREFRQKVEFARTLDHYALLELDRKSDEDTVRRRYYHLARSLHPDSLEGILAEACQREAEEYFSLITDAYNTLTRPEQRKEYNDQLRSKATAERETEKQDPTSLARENFLQAQRALNNGELHDATQFFRNAVQLDPGRGEYHRELGIVQMQNPQWQKSAEEALQRAVTLEQTDIRALSHLGRLYQMNGLKRRAIETYQKTLQWDEDNQIAQTGMAELSEDDDAPKRGGLNRILGRR